MAVVAAFGPNRSLSEDGEGEREEGEEEKEKEMMSVGGGQHGDDEGVGDGSQ